MKTRIVAGLAAAILLVALIVLGSPHAIFAVILVFATLAVLEFDKLFFSFKSVPRQVRLIALVLLSLWALRTNQIFGWVSMWLSFVLLSSVQVFQSARTGDFQASVRELSLEFLGFMYVTSLFGFMVPIVELPQGRELLLLLFILVFLGDTAAYFVGTLLGKHTLAERLSPKKSVEGAVGALVFSSVGAYAWIWYMYRGDIQQGWKLLLFAPAASVLAQMGDLFESMFKRSQAKKDSGSFLPGHGGVLDRLDGLALVSPVYYVYLTFLVR